MKIDISHLKFDERGLIPAIVQDVTTDKVLMLAYMNGQSLARTVETGYTWFWSRSRQELWNKGATSGNLQKVKSIVYDCDGDTLLVRVVQKGVACHEGNYSCFSYPLWNAGSGENLPVTYSDLPTVVDELYRKLTNEMRNRKDGSYAGYLFESGEDRILTKLMAHATASLLFTRWAIYGIIAWYCLLTMALRPPRCFKRWASWQRTNNTSDRIIWRLI